jgi:hypothetical protein
MVEQANCLIAPKIALPLDVCQQIIAIDQNANQRHENSL